MAVLAVPWIHLQEEGFSSYLVWPFLIAAFFLLVLFIAIDWQVVNPLVPFRALWNAKPISGTIMAVSAHISLIAIVVIPMLGSYFFSHSQRINTVILKSMGSLRQPASHLVSFF
ncbi:hypothetical protein [Fictibacillus enclensis]|uniref:hypothetical protein n=1 Tax=Fictibacillus enclensis TaxID=1017270 RepID=UPI0025A2E7F8|nr:hypothetical protein [Fictibacillus enclensis]